MEKEKKKKKKKIEFFFFLDLNCLLEFNMLLRKNKK